MEVNLSSKILNEPTTSVWAKGLNLAITPKMVPIKEIICVIETALKEIPLAEAEEI